jgi:HK97 family phage major capsid protein
MGDESTGEPGFDAILTALEAEERAAGMPGTGPLGATLAGGHPEVRTAGQVVTEAAAYQELRKASSGGATFAQIDMRGSFFYDGPGAEFRTNDTVTSATSGAGAAGVFRPVGNPADNPPRVRQRRLFVRDLLTVQGTGLASVPYIRESMPDSETANVVGGAQNVGAGMTSEGTAKTQVDMAWTQDDAPVRKVSAWIPLTTEIIDDAPTLMGYVDGRLVYLLAIREELQILDGSGTAPALKGILHFSGLQSQLAVAMPGETVGDETDTSLENIDAMATLGMAISKVETVDGEADGIAIHPLDYWTIITTRRADQLEGRGGIVDGGFATPPGSLWGLPTVRTRAVKQTEPIVGSWALGATLFDRQTTTIKVGNQHSDYFTTNRVAVVAEERVGLAVHRPDFFVVAHLHGEAA